MTGLRTPEADRIEQSVAEAREDISWGRHRLHGVSHNVFLLGVVSFIADVSGEMVYPIIPLFLTSTLGASVGVIGLIEGIAEGTGSLLKVVSGWFSDRFGRRKPLIMGGYSLSAVGKLLLALSFAWPMVLLARFVDRLGKGVRTSPRDALIGDSTLEGYSGRAFGFHRAMDTAGAVLGPLLALAIVALADDRLRIVFLIAVIPAALSVLPFAVVKEILPKRREQVEGSKLGDGVPRQFWLLMGVTVAFALVNSSDAFIILRAKDLGMSLTAVVLAYVVYNTLYSVLAFPLGDLSDRVGKRPVLVGGLAVYGCVYLGLALINGSAGVWPLFAVYGVYIAATEGVARSFVSDLAPAARRATLLGLYHTLIGVAAIIASAVAGLLWDAVSPRAPFFVGAVGALACAALLAALPLSGARRSAAAA